MLEFCEIFINRNYLICLFVFLFFVQRFKSENFDHILYFSVVCLTELSTGQVVLVSCSVLSCRTGRVFYFCPVLPPAKTRVGSRTGQKMHIRAEHRTGGPGVLMFCPVLSCRTGRVFCFCPVLPPARTKIGSRTGQERTKNLVLCSPLMSKDFRKIIEI